MYNPKLQFHFTGIGGSGMSGIAEVLLTLGFQVSGTDLRTSEVCKRLERMGAKIRIGHAAEHIPESASLLVYSSAVTQDNVEIVEAHRRGLPVVRRAEVLAELMRLKYGVAVAGSHGKTTTTTMTGTVLERGGLDPTIIIGGLVTTMESGSRLGAGNYLVAESDESDRSFLLLRPTIAVVTNIDAEHLSAYASLRELEESFATFVRSVPFYGLAILCVDDQRVRDLAAAYSGRKITYGISPDAHIRAANIEQKKGLTSYDLYVAGELQQRIEIPYPGKHFAVNSLAAVAAGLEFGIPVATIADALRDCPGVRRRVETVGLAGGITVISDYAHHPTEVKATLRAIREGWDGEMGKLHVIFQPHRYSRVKQCFVEFLDAFRDCDNLVLTDIYSAGETPLEGISSQKLCEAMNHSSSRFVSKIDDVLPGIKNDLNPGDVVICMGAGTIGAFPPRLIEALSDK